ncbi:MAG: hypothetical protein CL910_12160 [Deltaproteobacteria bacterium]|jgi:aminoglycoside phosphotransferase (APT) family kinase protein|nr:hypothetical protein [Deltaproteobacteria bacterium]
MSSELPPRDFGQRLGVLTGAQLQTACDWLQLGRVLAAEPAPSGLFGQNLFLTAESGEFVLRGCPHADWQLPKERRIARMIHEGTSVEAPWPYWVEPSRQTFGWAYAIMRRIPGVVDGAKSGQEHREVAASMGSLLAELHELAADRPAAYELDCDDFVPFPMSHPERIALRVSELCQSIREARPEALRAEDDEWIAAILEEARPFLRDDFQPRFVHHDFKPNNVLCRRGPHGWEAHGVVDLMEGYFGDPEEDLVRAIGSFARVDRGLGPAFVEAYSARRPLRPGHAERYRVYRLVDTLVFWEFGQRNDLWFRPEQRFRAFASGTLEAGNPFG